MTLHLQGQILDRKPDILADLIGLRSLAVHVCSSSILVCRLQEGRASLVSGVLAAADEGLK